MSATAGGKACDQLGETLLLQSTIKNHESDFAHSLAYLEYAGLVSRTNASTSTTVSLLLTSNRKLSRSQQRHTPRSASQYYAPNRATKTTQVMRRPQHQMKSPLNLLATPTLASEIKSRSASSAFRIQTQPAGLSTQTSTARKAKPSPQPHTVPTAHRPSTTAAKRTASSSTSKPPTFPKRARQPIFVRC